MERMMEWEEEGQVENLDLNLPGRDALGWTITSQQSSQSNVCHHHLH